MGGSQEQDYQAWKHQVESIFVSGVQFLKNRASPIFALRAFSDGRHASQTHDSGLLPYVPYALAKC